MTAPILPVGAFIWCRFPQHEANRVPGPSDHLHLCYIADTVGKDALTLYTTSVIWDTGTPEPAGVIVVSADQAAQMKQKPFVLDARRIGIFPITTEWFPDLEGKDHGIVHIANKCKLAERTRNISFLEKLSDDKNWLVRSTVLNNTITPLELKTFMILKY